MEQTGSDDLIVIARAVRTHGLKGEIVAELLTDFPERFDDVEELVVVAPSGERRMGQLEGYWFQKDRVVLKLAGYESDCRCRGFRDRRRRVSTASLLRPLDTKGFSSPRCALI